MIKTEKILLEIRDKLLRSSKKYDHIHFIYCDECKGSGLKCFGNNKHVVKCFDFSQEEYCHKCCGIGGYLTSTEKNLNYFLCKTCKGKGYFKTKNKSLDKFNMFAYHAIFSTITPCNDCDSYGVVDWLDLIIPPDKTTINAENFGEFYQ